MPAERRQLAMVNEALACLRKKARAGEVSTEVLLKVHQLAMDMASRNFLGASAIQAVGFSVIILFIVMFQ
jgi:hypothetical protein